MHRPLVLLALLVAAVSTALAEDPGNPPSAGTRGTVTAWDLSGTRVIEHRFCVRARGGWDYAECGARLRERVFAQLCTEGAPRVQRYLFQEGEAAPTPSSVSCTK